MTNITEEFYTSLKEIISNEKKFSIKFYIIDDEVETKLENAIDMIFDSYGKKDIAGIVYTCIKELIINGTKANLKRVLFELNDININREEDYAKGMYNFKNTLTENNAIKYLKNLKEKELYILVKFEYNKEGVKIEVINNSHITTIEDKRLRDKLKQAMEYEDIAQFYMDKSDEQEGAGMGIALLVILIKGLNIDPNLLRIGNTNDGNTLARIEIPLTDNYINSRKNA